jgi:putative tricarboxylic transport membrane protein
VLGGEVKAGITGIGETAQQIEAGDVRVLGVTNAERVPGLNAPTLQESGIDMEMVNWRGLVAPPGLSASDRAELIALVERTASSREWKATLDKNGWSDAFLPGEEFGRFIQSENQRVGDVLGELGLSS